MELELDLEETLTQIGLQKTKFLIAGLVGGSSSPVTINDDGSNMFCNFSGCSVRFRTKFKVK